MTPVPRPAHAKEYNFLDVELKYGILQVRNDFCFVYSSYIYNEPIIWLVYSFRSSRVCYCLSRYIFITFIAIGSNLYAYAFTYIYIFH